jgi:4-amino-4-deoxy-L-arabinose transferase-like glycosyltransferase
VSIADRSARWLLALRPLTGMLWCMVLVLPWFASILYRSGNAFLTESLGRDMLAKMTSGQEAHGAPPGYYLLLFWVTFWPGAVLAGLAAPMAWRTRREPAVQFLLAWLIPSWIVFELVVTKLPHYVLPLYPSIAILMAAALERGGLVHARWLARGTIGWFLFPAVLAIVNVVAFIYFTHNPGIVVWPFGAAAAVMGLFAWWLYDADGPERAILRAMVSAWLIAIMTYGITLPSLPALFPSVIVADMLREAKCERPQVAAAGYHEPSLVFLSGTQTRLVDGAGAAEFLRQGPCRFALVDARSERSFVQRAEAIGLRYRPLPPVDGYNVSNGRAVSMSVFQSNDRR